MNEEVLLVYEMCRERIENSLEHLDNELVRIRAGKANVHILDGVPAGTIMRRHKTS